MYKPLNPAYEEHALFFNPAYMQMRLKGNEGPKHYLAPRGVSADMDGNVTFTMYVSVISTIAVRLLLSWLLGIVLKMGVIGIAIAMVCDWSIRAVIFFWRQKSGKWKTFQVI